MSEHSIEYLPYELTAEQMAKERLELIAQRYGTNPHTIVANLEEILKEYGHDCVELGMAIADHFPTTGPVDILEAFEAGTVYGKDEGSK
jgi:hypothetical protein